MKKIFLSFNEKKDEYWPISGGHSSLNLYNLYIVLCSLDKDEFYRVEVIFDNRNHSVLLYSDELIKEMRKFDIDITPIEERMAFEKEYDKYYARRYEEVPKVKMLQIDFEILKEEWKKAKETKKNILF